MSFFPLLFLGLMVLTHLYLYWNLQRALPPDLGWARVAVGIIVVIGLAAVLLRRVVLPWDSMIAKWLYLWIAFVLVAVMFLLLRDALHAAALLADRWGGWQAARFFSGQRGARIGLALACLGFAYCLYEATAVGVTRLEITTPKLPASRPRLRIVAVSDLHLTQRGDGDRLGRVVRLINAQKPDLVVMLGDLVDDYILEQKDLLSGLQAIEAPLGKFAVLGNHELYNGWQQSHQFTTDAGFRILRGERVDTADITVAGVDDPAFRGSKGIAETLADAPGGQFVLLLTHRPITPEETIGAFDLQMSGHTHGGQLLPGRLLTWLSFRRHQGLNHLTSGDGKHESLLFLTNGAGYWGPPVRFLAPPEIVVVDVIRGTSKSDS